MWHLKWHCLHERTCVNNIFSKMSFLKSTCNFVLKGEYFENILRVPNTFPNVNLDRVIGKICQMQIFHYIYLEGLVNTVDFLTDGNWLACEEAVFVCVGLVYLQMLMIFLFAQTCFQCFV